MVNNQNCRKLQAGQCQTRTTGRGGTAICNGPVYDLVGAQLMLSTWGMRVINESALASQTEDFQPELTDDELCNFILALTGDDYVGSERCNTTPKIVLDCDEYATKWNRNTQKRWEHGAKIYVKFGFTLTPTKCLVVRVHPSRW